MRRLMLAALAGVLWALSGPAAATLASPPHTEVAVEPASPAARLDPMKHVAQTMNNCGPAAVVMALSTLGIDESQEFARLALRGSDVRRGMGPEPVGDWVDQRFGLKAVWRFSGTNELMKQLVTNGFAPMVTQWMDDPSVSRISHWRVVRGYDDAKGVFYVNDSMLGNDIPLTYDWFDQNWLPFGYRYMVIYEPDDEPLLRAIIGEQWDDYAMREAHHERMEALARGQGTSAAWVAYGEAAYQFGLFEEAIAAIEKGLELGSGTGLFTLRSSLPNAYRAIGRFDEANASEQRLRAMGVSWAGSAAPVTPDAWELDTSIADVISERELRQRLWQMMRTRYKPF